MTVQPPRPLAGLTILVVDDHRDTVDVFREYIQSAGATVIGAGSAKAALAVTETHTLDAVLIDLRLRGEDGHWFLRQLRTSRVAHALELPVFAVSGERYDLPGSASGFAGHFLKPVDLDILVATLAALPRGPQL